MAGRFHFKKRCWQKWIWLCKLLRILFQHLVPKNKHVEQLFPQSIVATSIQSSISNPNLIVPSENTIAKRSLLPFLEWAFPFLEQKTFHFW